MMTLPVSFKKVTLVILIFTINFNLYSLNSGPINKNNKVVVISETVELALVIASLTSLDNKTNNSIDRSTDYFKSIEKYFSAYKTHPIITTLSSSYNLPRLVGNAADYSFNKNGNLIKVDSSGSLWKDEENNLFSKHLNLIQDFAQKSNFRAFFNSHKQLYTSSINRTRKAIDEKDMLLWLEANFAVKAKPVKIFISPLMSGFNWTTVFKPEQRIWIWIPYESEVANSMKRLNYARAIFTEIDHGYVNPVTAQNLKKLENAFSNLNVWANENGIENYPSAELIFNEYMTWALFLMYAQSKAPSEEFKVLKDKVIAVMEKRRGFVKFGIFTEECLRLYNTGTKGKNIQLKMIQWASKY